MRIKKSKKIFHFIFIFREFHFKHLIFIMNIYMSNSNNPETLSLHAEWRADETTGSVAVPIHQTTS